ncbi:hypothetical protein F2Q68_00043126 [Brassica cretica]|uniref:Uncharacterized protein n=1 Tax=Brassica cretica TaxID=69181 RepID=A0A8S9LSF3_BRACR|nr:hypothetical protein F2Q68_00043126 [Brassica cretica]
MLKLMTKTGTWIEICRFSQIIAKNHFQESTTPLCLLQATGEMAQKIVFQALREAMVTETVVRHFRTFAKLRKSTQADSNVNKSKDGSSSIFDEIQHDSIDQEKPASKRRNTAQNQHSAANHNHMRSNDENKKPSLAPPSGTRLSLPEQYHPPAIISFPAISSGPQPCSAGQVYPSHGFPASSSTSLSTSSSADQLSLTVVHSDQFGVF